jgi:hypothetical protein
MDTDPLGTFLAKNKDAWSKIPVNGFGNALGNSLAQQQRFAVMDARVDEVMGDVLANGERLAALNAPAREMPLDDENARALGADSEGRVVVVGNRPPSWLEENILQPVEHALSATGHFVNDVGQAIGDGLSDLLAKPSGSTDEIPAQWNNWGRPVITGPVDYSHSARDVLLQTGPMLVPIDPTAEARRAAASARVATNIGILAGGPLTGYAAGAQMLGAPNDVVNNIGIAQAGVFGSVALGSSSQPIYTGPRSPLQQFVSGRVTPIEIPGPGLSVEVSSFPNLIPGDPVMPGPRYRLVTTEGGQFKYQLPSGEMRTPKGNFDFVQVDGEIRIAPPRDDFESGHLSLAKGSPVEYAGTIQFSQKGALKWWDNNSGHYQPNASAATQANLPIDLFKPTH